MKKDKTVPTENDIIKNSKPNHLYSHDFGNGKYMSVVHEDKEGATLQVSTKIQLKIVYMHEKDEVSGFEVTKLRQFKNDEGYQETTEKIKLSGADLNDIVAFAKFISETDLRGISERRIKLGDESLDALDDDTKRKLKTLLSTNDGQDIILTLLNEGAITSLDIVNVGYRKGQLEIFKKLLSDHYYWKEYASEQIDMGESLDKSKEEKTWQYFFKRNPWIFGYGLDYKYIDMLQDESVVRGSDASGKGREVLDVLAGTSKYTVLIEMKKPSTKLFEKDQNRANSWRLSTDLFSAVSQILEYKAGHTIEWENGSKHYDNNGSEITQKALDPKTVLVIGSDSMFDGTDKEKQIKRRTFELYCRDSRNIKILTYDELFRRASFIVETAEK